MATSPSESVHDIAFLTSAPEAAQAGHGLAPHVFCPLPSPHAKLERSLNTEPAGGHTFKFGGKALIYCTIVGEKAGIRETAWSLAHAPLQAPWPNQIACAHEVCFAHISQFDVR